jgi:hypothetical protein
VPRCYGNVGKKEELLLPRVYPPDFVEHVEERVKRREF